MKVPPVILPFLKELKENNCREWFTENKPSYLKAKVGFENLVKYLIYGINQFYPDVKYLEPADCIFRIYRDIRFSKNGEPYKTNMGAYMALGGRKSELAGFYVHIEPEKSFAGGGLYMPQSPVLKKVRSEIYHRSDEFENILHHPDFKKVYGGLEPIEVLKKSPQGYPADAPEVLRNKHFIASRSFTDNELALPDFTDQVIEAFRVLLPLVVFLNSALEE